MSHEALKYGARPAPGVSRKRASKTDRLGSSIGVDGRRPRVVAQVAKSRTAQLRIAVVRWSGVDHLEIAEFTAAIPGLFQATGVPIWLPLDKLPELIAVLQAAGRVP